MREKSINTHQVSYSLCYQDYMTDLEWQSSITAVKQQKLALSALHDLGQSIQLNQLQAQVTAGASILTLGHFNYVCPMQDWQYLLNSSPRPLNEHLNQNLNAKTIHQTSRWFSSRAYFNNVELKEPDLNLNLDFHPLWVEKLKLICQVQKNYPNHKIKYSIPGPLTYLWFNNYLGKSKSLTPEKIDFLPKLIHQYKIIIQHLKNLDINWIQLEDPVFITDIHTEFQDKITQAYQDLLENVPNMMLATYFGGIDENINWMKKIPFQGLHIDLDNAPEQIMFVLKNDIMKNLQVLSLSGITQKDSHLASIKEYMKNFIEFKPDIWVSFSDKIKKDKPRNAHDIVQLYLEINLDCPDNYPKILALQKLLNNLKTENPQIKFSTESLNELTCFMKKRDQADFIKNIKILSNII